MTLASFSHPTLTSPTRGGERENAVWSESLYHFHLVGVEGWLNSIIGSAFEKTESIPLLSLLYSSLFRKFSKKHFEAFDRVWHPALSATLEVKYQCQPSSRLFSTSMKMLWVQFGWMAAQENGSEQELVLHYAMTPSLAHPLQIFLKRILSDALEKHDGKNSIVGRAITDLWLASQADLAWIIYESWQIAKQNDDFGEFVQQGRLIWVLTASAYCAWLKVPFYATSVNSLYHISSKGNELSE